jgi:hypothetical protein
MHGHALVHAVAASLTAERGEAEAAEEHFHAAYEAAAGTKDMPMLAAVAVAGATVAATAGDRAAAADLLAAANAIRGADDPTNPEITRLALDVPAPPARAEGLALLQRLGSRPAAIGP